MPIILTITNEIITVDGKIYNYTEYDRILKNIHKNEYEVFYSGQNKGKIDHLLIEAIRNNDIFKIYYRKNKKKPYKFLGETNIVDIIQYRQVPVNSDTQVHERLQIHMVVSNISNVDIPVNNFIGSGKFKKDILVHAGLRDTENNSLIQHNRNTNIGFYYYSI